MLRDVPGSVLSAELKALNMMMSKVHKAYPRKAIFNLKQAGIFPIAPRSVVAAAKTSKAKLVLFNDHWKGCKRNLEEAFSYQNSKILHPFKKWVESCSVKTLQRAVEEIIDSDLAREVTIRVIRRDDNTIVPHRDSSQDHHKVLSSWWWLHLQMVFRNLLELILRVSHSVDSS